MSTTIPTPVGPYLAHIHPDSTPTGSASLLQGWYSWVLAELWFPHLREAPGVLSALPLSGSFPALSQLSTDALPALFSGQATIAIPRLDWIRELRQLAAALQRQPTLCRFLFAPMLPAGTPQPTYSRCKLRTGAMVAGYDLCRINRNWDGTDRVEDLTSRDVFTDASGDIAILRRPLSAHLNDDLLALADSLERQAGETFYLSFSRYPKDEDPDKLALDVLERAEHWRVRWGIPDYSPTQIHQINRRWNSLIAKGQGSAREAADLGAYLSEMMRATWGGQYRPGDETESQPARPKTKAKAKAKAKAKPKPQKGHNGRTAALVLQLPFDCEVASMEKALRSWQQRRKVDWRLQFDVLVAQRRQRWLLLLLGQQLFHTDPERNHAALRLLDDIQDGRIDRLMIETLAQGALVARDVMHILERLGQSRMPVPARILVPLVQGEHIGVAARALLLLGRQGWELLPELIAQRLAGGAMLQLRPLARQLLTALGEHPKHANEHKVKTQARNTLRSLGPIPPANSPEQLLPSPPPPLLPLPMLSELLEDSANPTRHEAALQIVMMFPNRDEEETLGAALADPDPKLRCAVIGLLASCDRPLATQLLKTRALFEQDPLCLRLIRVALAGRD